MSDILENLSEKTQNLYAPLSKFNEVLLDNLTQLIDLQSKSIIAYTDMGIEQAKSTLEIKDMDALSGFIKQQSTVAEKIQKQFKGDIEKLTELAGNFKTDVEDVLNPSAKKDAPKKAAPKAPAKPAAKKPAAKTAAKSTTKTEKPTT
jgi:phasin family protein